VKDKESKEDNKLEVKKELVKGKKNLTREERMEKDMDVVLEKVMKRHKKVMTSK